MFGSLLRTFGMTALALIVPAFGLAQSGDFVLPELFSVKDIADDDVLNIRNLPGTEGEIIGSMGPGDEGIEVVRLSEDGKWGLVNETERSGWASMRYLEPENAGNTLAERRLLCSGTEPFWSLVFDGEQNAYLMDYNIQSEQVEMTMGWNAKEVFNPAGVEMLELQSTSYKMNIALTRSYCDDGMSDYEYGISLLGRLIGPHGEVAYNGCCSLDTR